ncbi:GDSL esterase/lipase [Platanthera zijinensis]|uniref:GDSL esterase/lipase n=1 Tax=Platanthera zijinensis TaxID=2320716 RepID=A0AAP0BJ76_9ASPA
MAWSLVLGNSVAPPEARALFVFGDSRVDNGNNNYLATTARANTQPYGIDYPTHRPTGRFCNGLIVPDIISEHLGAEFILPYLSPELEGEKLLLGANFASAGVGVLNDTGVQLLQIIKIYDQIGYFEQYQERVAALIGPDQTQNLVNGGLVLITLGGNDFINNYYLTPLTLRSLQYSLPDYVRYVVSEYKKILMRIYELGARRVLASGTGPMGCLPGELALRSKNGDCDPELQRAADLFNGQMIQTLSELNKEVAADVFIAVNALKMQMDFISDPQAYGFVSSKIACCGQGPYKGIGLCNTQVSTMCPDRNVYVFWDAFHTSERANRILVSQFMHGSIEYMYPMNLSTILAMDAKA